MSLSEIAGRTIYEVRLWGFGLGVLVAAFARVIVAPVAVVVGGAFAARWLFWAVVHWVGAGR